MTGEKLFGRGRLQWLYRASPYLFLGHLLVFGLLITFSNGSVHPAVFGAVLLSSWVAWALGLKAECQQCGAKGLMAGYLQVFSLSPRQRLRIIFLGDCPFCEGWLTDARSLQMRQAEEKTAE